MLSPQEIHELHQLEASLKGPVARTLRSPRCIVRALRLLVRLMAEADKAAVLGICAPPVSIEYYLAGRRDTT